MDSSDQSHTGSMMCKYTGPLTDSRKIGGLHFSKWFYTNYITSHCLMLPEDHGAPVKTG